MPSDPIEFIESKCDAARNVLDDFGPDKALGYLIGEKFLNFLAVAEKNAAWRQAIPGFVAEIRSIFTSQQIVGYLTTPHRLGPLGHTASEEGHRMPREALEESEKAREDARNLLLLEWAKDLLVEEDSATEKE